MHPGFMGWWHAQRRHGCGPVAAYAIPLGACGPRGARAEEPSEEGRYASGFEEGGFSGGAFGVRRPLRFLAYKLELDKAQTSELAAILDALKTERAQAAVDYRRYTSALADAVAADPYNASGVAEAGELRVKSADRLRNAVARALERIHTLLTDEQRKKFAYYLRTGVIVI